METPLLTATYGWRTSPLGMVMFVDVERSLTLPHYRCKRSGASRLPLPESQYKPLSSTKAVRLALNRVLPSRSSFAEDRDVRVNQSRD